MEIGSICDCIADNEMSDGGLVLWKKISRFACERQRMGNRSAMRPESNFHKTLLLTGWVFLGLRPVGYRVAT
jgi:hypothetical protein